MNKPLTHQDFLNAGYRHFSQQGLKEYTNEGFQKKITDDKGVRYFITVYIYDWRSYAQVPYDYSYEPDVQFNTQNPVNVKLLYPDSITEIETKLNTIWKALGCPYYERSE
jgi:hypothetical protein